MTVPVKRIGLLLLFGKDIFGSGHDGKVSRPQHLGPGLGITLAARFGGEKGSGFVDIRHHGPADAIQFGRNCLPCFARYVVARKRPE